MQLPHGTDLSGGVVAIVVVEMRFDELVEVGDHGLLNFPTVNIPVELDDLDLGEFLL